MRRDSIAVGYKLGPGAYRFGRSPGAYFSRPSSIALADEEGYRVVRVVAGCNGASRTRALRVDEAKGALDVQLLLDDLHSIDRAKMRLQRFYVDRASLIVTKWPVGDAQRLELTRTGQLHGERWWWMCPLCAQRRRYLYFVEAAYGTIVCEPARILGCRVCLGLAYASSSRHKCADQDHKEALSGNSDAFERILRRQQRKERNLKKFRRSLYRQIDRLLELTGDELPPELRERRDRLWE